MVQIVRVSYGEGKGLVGDGDRESSEPTEDWRAMCACWSRDLDNNGALDLISRL